MCFLASISLLAGLLAVLVMPAGAEPAWQYRPDPDLVAEREFALGIDGVHRVAYRFGGTIGGIVQSSLWQQALDDPLLVWQASNVTTASPPPRRRAQSFFDTRRNRYLVLGGLDQDSTAQADVWAYDPVTGAWSQPPIAPGGPATITDDYPLTYDSRRDRLVYVNDQNLAAQPRVWLLDLAGPTLSWTALRPASTFHMKTQLAPGWRFIGSAAYDSTRDRLFVLPGPLSDSLFFLRMATPDSFLIAPLERFGQTVSRMAVDRAHDRLVIDFYREFQISEGPSLWTLDLSNLAAVTMWNDDRRPLDDRVVGWAIDPIAASIEVLVQERGKDLRFSLDYGDSMRWSFRDRADRLQAADGLAGAVDPAGRAWYVHGGNRYLRRWLHDTGFEVSRDLFLLDLDDPVVFERIAPPGEAPGPLTGAVAVLDSIGRRIVFHGGRDATGILRSETWALDLDPQPHWSRLATATEGPARAHAAAAIDASNRMLYLLGGDTLGVDPHPGWLWSLDLSKNPAAWEVLIPGSPPFFGHAAIGGQSAIGFDRIRNRLLGVEPDGRFTIDLGLGGPPILTETDFPDGYAHFDLMGAFDTKRNLLFVHGGWQSISHTGKRVFTSAAWNGTDYHDSLFPLSNPQPPDAAGLLAHDPVRDRLLIVNGDSVAYPEPYLPVYGLWTVDLDGLVPTRLDFAEASIQGGSVRVRFAGAGADGAVEVERELAASGDWTWIGTAREVSSELYELLDDRVVPGSSYRYRARFTSGGETRVTATSAPIHVPGAVSFALRAPAGAVGRGWPVVLEGRVTEGTDARMELVDVAGRIVDRRTVTHPAGSFTVKLAPLRPSAGIYFARLVQGDRTVTLKLVRF